MIYPILTTLMHFVSGWFFFYDFTPIFFIKTIDKDGVGCYLFQNAYVLEADLVLSNPKLIRKYEYSSNILGIPVERTDDWCLYTDKNGNITEQCVGGRNCYQMVGISYWNAEAGAKLANDMDEVYRSPGGKERYWDQVALHYKKENYQVAIRECKMEDIVEIDSFNELKQIDSLYADKN